MRNSSLFAFFVILSLSACGNIERTSQSQQPLDRSLLAGPGDVVLRVDRERNLENVVGKADVFGRKTKEGHSEVRFAGVEKSGEIVLYRKEVQIITNETTMSRTPISTTSGASTTSISGNATTYGDTTRIQGTGTTSFSSTTLNPASDYHIIIPSDTVAIRLSPNEKRIPIGGYIIEILAASTNALEYRITKQ